MGRKRDPNSIYVICGGLWFRLYPPGTVRYSGSELHPYWIARTRYLGGQVRRSTWTKNLQDAKRVAAAIGRELDPPPGRPLLAREIARSPEEAAMIQRWLDPPPAPAPPAREIARSPEEAAMIQRWLKR